MLWGLLNQDMRSLLKVDVHKNSPHTFVCTVFFRTEMTYEASMVLLPTFGPSDA